MIGQFLTSFWLVCQFLINIWGVFDIIRHFLTNSGRVSEFCHFLTYFWRVLLTYLVISWLIFDIFGRNLTGNKAKLTWKTRQNLITHSRHFSSHMTYSSESDVNMTSISDVRISSDIDVKWTSERRHWRRGQEMTSIWRYTDEKCLLWICWLWLEMIILSG